MAWLDHTFSATQHLFRYNPKAMANDRRVSYKSKKHPWLVMVGLYGRLLPQGLAGAMDRLGPYRGPRRPIAPPR